MSNSSVLSGLRKAGQLQAEKAGSEPLACIVEEVSQKGVKVSVLGHGPHGKPGDILNLAVMSDSTVSLDNIFKGGITEHNERKRVIWPSSPGDLMIFEKAVTLDGTAHVDRLATRTHAGLDGEIQVLQCLVKPTMFSRTQAGMTQFAFIVNPEFVGSARTMKDVAEFYENVGNTQWPGGAPAIMFRRGGKTLTQWGEKVDNRPETPTEYAQRIAEEGLIDPKSPLEMLPVWSLPVGLHQKFREGPPIPHQDGQKHLGSVTANYVEKSVIHYRESFVILGREPEIKFGKPTGKRPMTILGMHPLAATPKLLPEEIPAGRKCEHPVRMFYETKSEMTAAIADKTKKRNVFLARVKHDADPDEPVSLRF
jgi:hypothetical protein